MIENAADIQMNYLHTCSTGKHVDLAEKLLNEMSAARICLLNTEKKAAYDVALRKKLDMKRSRSPKANPSDESSNEPESESPEYDFSDFETDSPLNAKPKDSSALKGVVRMSLAVGSLLLGYLIFVRDNAEDSDPKEIISCQ